jgi:integrase
MTTRASSPRAKRRKAPRNKPILVPSGSVTTRIYKMQRKTGCYYLVAWQCGSKRERQYCRTLEEARKFAKAQADRIAAGTAQSARISMVEAQNFREAQRHMVGLDIPLHAAASEYASLRRALGERGTLQQAVEFFRLNSIRPELQRSVTEVYREFLAAKAASGCSQTYLDDCRLRLARFAKDFQMPISEVTTRDLEDWLFALTTSLVTRDNFRRLIITLFNFARRRGYLPRDRETEAKWLEKPKLVGRPIQVFTTGELTELLEASEGQARLAIALGAFTGIRSAEMLRLQWQDFNWAEEVIDLGSDQTKTASRRLVPILPALRAWIGPSVKKFGPVLSYSLPACLAEAFGSAAKKATKLRRRIDPDAPKLVWKQNALRHSYGSYRLAVVPDAAKVSLEMGNSPQKMFSNYRKVVTKAQGEAWFAIRPKMSENLILLPSQQVA